MNDKNIILATDSYKLNHWNQYPHDTTGVYSYFESRHGATYPYTVFVGLQAILMQYMVGRVVTGDDVREAHKLAKAHFGADLFNVEGWMHIVTDHGGKLPLRIKAVPEGAVVPEGNVLMTVENTCPKCYWLTNAMESLLTHVWYPSTVATLSRATKVMMGYWLDQTADDRSALPFMLHDFGYRGASSHESAALGGFAHLVNFMGTDTLPAMLTAVNYYGADLDTLAFSVPATEHSVMTARGWDGEWEVIDQLLEEYPSGILSVVADSFDIYEFVTHVGTTCKDRVMARDGKLVIRPDSITKRHPTPEALTLWIVERLYTYFGGHVNSKGYKVLDPHIGVLWGDGIGPEGIETILHKLEIYGFSAENMVFGMGGGLLQKVNRDTQRFAFKASAIKRDGDWVPIQKRPLDASKTSKKGRMILALIDGKYRTVGFDSEHSDQLVTVFEDGELVGTWTLEQMRDRAAVAIPNINLASSPSNV